MENMEKYNKAFLSIFNIDEIELNDSFVIGKTHNWDSIRHLSLMTTIEDEFEIMLESEDILDFKSYNAGKDILAKYGIII
jgi:acyl carrier protein